MYKRRISVYVLQYDVRRRISADESLKSHYFDSLGHAVHALLDSQYTVYHNHLISLLCLIPFSMYTVIVHRTFTLSF